MIINNENFHISCFIVKTLEVNEYEKQGDVIQCVHHHTFESTGDDWWVEQEHAAHHQLRWSRPHEESWLSGLPLLNVVPGHTSGHTPFPPNQKSIGVKSGDRGGQRFGKKRLMTRSVVKVDCESLSRCSWFWVEHRPVGTSLSSTCDVPSRQESHEFTACGGVHNNRLFQIQRKNAEG